MFADRTDAGRRLSARLEHLRGQDVVVLGLPRGGVVVAFEAAQALGAPLDVILVRKLGVPIQPELGFGAIGEDGVRVLNPDIIRAARLSPEDMARVEENEHAVLRRRAEQVRAGRPKVSLTGRTAVIVDDGIATGSTARAACQVARAQGASRIVLAAPVCPPEAAELLRADADEVICLETPADLGGIGLWYHDFRQVGDDEVADLLRRAGDRPYREEEVRVPAGAADLPGTLVLPDGADAIVVFAHGSGSGRRSPRNRYVAGVLNQAGLGTLLFDLLTGAEGADRRNVFDIELLAERLRQATAWLRERAPAARIGYFGASTGAAAALWAAAGRESGVAAVVSRGGRPDLAGPHLAAVTAPTLLIVGQHDEAVLELNRSAQQRLGGESQLEIVPGATHLFEEPGALERVAELASDWFARHLLRSHAGSR
ncbi:alpha/beta family hydrolase [Nonomuraea basaltis]|uniref:alpha/beta family hydrolase n=1 Tax=Nonomuraea basaltis TaxID=2495887 RepID=UPI00110C3FE1|nr:alpha/beta family hydrolase [Nonomuraea basaltis]TMS00610.1 phosphoribosyltransferase [Nonomuraea basaltis]